MSKEIPTLQSKPDDQKDIRKKSDYKWKEVVNMMMLDEIDKTHDAYMDVRKKNNEKDFPAFASYLKIYAPKKETGTHQENASFHADNLTIKEADDLIRNELDKLESRTNHDAAVELIRSDAIKEYANSHGMTADEAMEKLSKTNNGTKFSMVLDPAGLLHAHFNEKIVTKNDTAPENAVVKQDSKDNVQSELQELLKAKIKDITDTKKTAINIKDSIFGKSYDIFSVWKGENITEIMKSKESKKDFLEKIPKSGKTFFNKLIKQVPPESGDTMRRWIARVAIEANKQKE